jgi:hypothetical protein
MSAAADRMAKARRDFQEAMARGCSIADLRAARERDRHWAQSARKADAESRPAPAAPSADFRTFEASWMMRD